MSKILEVLLAGRTLDETLSRGAKEIKRIGGESSVRVFRVTRDNGFVTTELYPNSKSASTMSFEASKKFISK